MKKLVTLAIIGLAAGALATPPYSVTSNTNSVQLVPAKPIRSGDYTAWATNTAYAQGSIVSSGGKYYFCTQGGTSSTNALTATDAVITDGTAKWVYTLANRRNGCAVSVKTTGGTADLSFGTSSAVTTNGFRLVGEGHAIIFGVEDNYQGEVHAISGSAVVLGVQEF